MIFNNLALSGWSFEIADEKINLDNYQLNDRLRKKNPVKNTFIYSDPSSWEERLKKQVRNTANMAGVDGNNYQVIIGVHNGFNKHPEGASPVVMEALNNDNAYMFDISLGCASIILASQIAGTHLIDNNVHNIMLGSVQMTTQYTNNFTDGNCIFADGIGALSFSRANKGNMIRYTSISSNYKYRDMFVMDENSTYHMQKFHKGKELSEFMINSFAKHLRESCKVMKIFPNDIDFIAISASNYAGSKMILENAHFPTDRSGINCLKEVPHMGTNDLIYQLQYGIDEGMIRKGSKILITGTSLGFSIGTMAIEWGYE